MFDEEWKLLILEENNDPFDVDLPGGGLDHGEEPYAALVREIQEETWCTTTISPQPLTTRVRIFEYNGIYYFFIGYACHIDLTTFQTSDEASKCHFYSKEFLIQNKLKFHRLQHIIENYDEILEMYKKSIF